MRLSKCGSCGAPLQTSGYGTFTCKKCGSAHVVEPPPPPPPAAGTAAPKGNDTDRLRADMLRRADALDREIAEKDPGTSRWPDGPPVFATGTVVRPLGFAIFGAIIIATSRQASVVGLLFLIFGGLIAYARRRRHVLLVRRYKSDVAMSEFNKKALDELRAKRARYVTEFETLGQR